MSFEFKKLEIPNVILVTPQLFEDERGYFMESYKQPDFKKAGIDFACIQENVSKSTHGVLRGLHYQRDPYAQHKVVMCTKGSILDVAVDIRQDSTTFGKYVSKELTEKNKKMLFIPRGFAHGFLVLSNEAEVRYKVDKIYSPNHEAGIMWNDKDVNIKWPIVNPVLSQKDRTWPTLSQLAEKRSI